MPSAFKSPVRNEIAVSAQKENGFDAGRGEFSYDENVFARLKVAQDSLIEDLECKIVVANVVNQAVLGGIVKALAEESSSMLAEKDEEIAALQKLRGEEHAMQLQKISGECFEKLKANEMVVLEKERELCKMAESLVDLTFRLQGESLNNLALEKKIREVEAKDVAKQRNINRLGEEIESLRREKSEEIESLKRELRLKEVRYSEQLEETIAESEAQLAALREKNSEQLATISALATNQEELMETQKESMEAIEQLRVSLEEQKLERDQELEILVEVYEGRLHDEKLVHGTEADILVSYFSSLMSEQSEVDAPDSVESAVEELEKEIILDCFSGFWEELRPSLDQTGDARRQASHWKSRSLHAQQRLIEQCYQHQTEMDVLMEFFVSKLRELEGVVLRRSEAEPGDGGTPLAELHRENAMLRREKDQVLIDKTEEMFRLKRDFFKELDKQKMESDEFLKKQVADSRQKLDRILEKKQQQQQQQHSDSETGSQSGDSIRVELEQLPELVSDLRNDIVQLMLDTGMADDGEEKLYGELQDDYDVLSLKYEELVKVVEVEKQRNDALSGDLQELEHNVNLSNGELERLLRQLEGEKQARLQKEAELQTIKSDVTLLRRQMETVLSQLENERSLKKRMQSDSDSLQAQVEFSKQRLESLHKELQDVLRIKTAVTEEHQKLRSEIGVMRGSLQRSIEDQSAAMWESLASIRAAVEENETRARKVNDRLHKLAKLNRRKQSSFLLNLQRAEEEVDMLGDENDYLVSLLERVFLALQHYSQVLQHYPGIAELRKLIKQELVSRIESPGL